MNRRTFLKSLGLSVSLPLAAQEGPPVPDRVETIAAGAKPAMALNHLGFVPKSRKTVIFRLTAPGIPLQFELEDIAGPHPPFIIKRPLHRISSDFGEALTGDFSDVERVGMYQVTIGGERSVPFFIRPDLWRRTLPKAFSFYPQQRCGIAVPNVHPVCHLDDARRRDTGQHVDVTGGWHDAGDLRKWMETALHSGVALLVLARTLGAEWNLDGAGLNPLLDEIRWGNRYWMKMQDSDGKIWNDAAGGVNGDNSDNHWTDNQTGTEDDRYINPEKPNLIQAEFVTAQALIAQVFNTSDPSYGQVSLAAALRCWEANTVGKAVEELSWWLLAAIELSRATHQARWTQTAIDLGDRLLAHQNREYIADQKQVRGFWKISEQDSTPYVNAIFSAMPCIALLELAQTFPNHPQATKWREAVQLHLEEYVLPLSGRSVYKIVPYGVFQGSPTPEFYRPLAGKLTYRYFMPVRKQFWWLGMTSHLENYACLLAMAARTFQKREFLELAYRQLEWVMGANPFAACLMTGEGMRNPFPHSRFVGLIPGGIMNGIGGNAQDEPVLDVDYGFDWRTCEYWAPHNAWYLWAVSEIEKGATGI